MILFYLIYCGKSILQYETRAERKGEKQAMKEYAIKKANASEIDWEEEM